MTRLTAFRRIVTAPRDHVDQGKIGRRTVYATSDGRERLIYVMRVLRSTLRKVD